MLLTKSANTLFQNNYLDMPHLVQVSLNDKLEIRTFNQNLYYFFSDQFQSSESCDCKTVNSCKWSREALLEINGLSKGEFLLFTY